MAIRPLPSEEYTEAEMEWAASYLDAIEAELNPTPVVFFGQEGVKAQIKPFLSRTRFPHTLLLGEPGIGKSLLARWIANQGRHPFNQLDELFCPVGQDLIPTEGLVLLDEIHRQGHPEWLYPIMDGSSGPTILAATTRPELLEPALVSRFFLRLHLERYDQAAMEELLEHWQTESHIRTLGAKDSIQVLARAGAGNPRQLRRIYETAMGVESFDPGTVLAAARITADGLTDLHLKYLKALAKLGRPAGLATLAQLLYLDPQTIRDTERLLLEFELMEMTPAGRVLSKQGRQYVATLP